jgi:hypothetical protein
MAKEPLHLLYQTEPDYQTVDLNSLENEQIRSVGGESVVLEMEVICHSTAKEIKEQGIKNQFERRFEQKLTAVCQAIHKKGRKKNSKRFWKKSGD